MAAALGYSGTDATQWLSARCDMTISRCSACGDLFRAVDGHEHDENQYCGSCFSDFFSTCRGCDDIYPIDDAHAAEGGDWCGDCYSARFVECDDCCETICRCRAHFDEDGNWYCETCYLDNEHAPPDDAPSSLEYARAGIKGYSCDVLASCAGFLSAPGESTDSVHGNARSRFPTLWMGFELEVALREGVGIYKAAGAINTAFARRGILKTDRSIVGRGFELSVPATLAYHTSAWGELLAQ